MSRRSKIIVLVAAIVALLGSFLLLGKSPSSDTELIQRDPDRTVVRGRNPGPQLALTTKDLSAFVEPGVSDRQIAGVVVNQSGPLAGARIELRAPMFVATGVGALALDTDAEGRFDFGLQPPSNYVLVASYPDHAAKNLVIQLRNPTEAFHDLKVLLQGCEGRVEGIVEDVHGSPITTATLTSRAIMVGAYSFALRQVPVDSEGRFRVCRTPRRGEFWYASAPGYASAMLAYYTPVRVVLPPAGRIRGRVVDSNGKGVANAQVNLDADEEPSVTTVFSDASGNFEADGLLPDTYEVSPQHQEHMFRPPGTEVTLLAGQQIDGIELRFSSCRTLAGVVEEEDGTPAAGKWIAAGWITIGEFASAFVQEDGSFVIPCAQYEEIEMFVPERELVAPRIPAGKSAVEDLVVTLKSIGGATITGTVTVDNVPAGGVTVASGDPSGITMSPFRPKQGPTSTTTNSDGRYTLVGLLPGKHEISALDPIRRSRSDSQIIDVSDGESRNHVDINLSHVGTLTGRVVTEDEDPVSGVLVQLVAAKKPTNPGIFGSARYKATTDDDGQFRVRGLRSDVYIVRVYEQKPVHEWPSIEYIADDESKIVLVRIRRVGEPIAGRVTLADGSPASYARVRSKSYVLRTIADEQGKFSLAGAREGKTYTLIASSPGSAGGLKAGLRAGQRDVSIVLLEKSTLIVEVDGTACKVTIRRANSVTAERGDSPPFRFDGLAPGTVGAEARCKEGGQFTSVSLAAGETMTITMRPSELGKIEANVRRYPSGALVGHGDCFIGAVNGTIDAQGTAVLIDVSPGAHQVTCGHEDGAGVAVGKANVAVGPGASPAITVHTVSLDYSVWDPSGKRLGAKLAASSTDESSIVFTEIFAKGIAQNAGVLAGDTLISVHDAPVTGSNSNAAKTFLESRPIGVEVPITVRREEKVVPLVLRY